MKIVVVLLALCCIGLIVACVRLQSKAKATVELNKKTQAQNKYIEEENRKLLQENREINDEVSASQFKLETIREGIDVQQDILQNLTDSNNKLQADAEERAQKIFDDRVILLQEHYSETQKRLAEYLEHTSSQLLEQIKQQQNQLEDLESKQRAYLEAEKRAEEIEARQDYYRLVLSDIDIAEVSMLRDLQPKFSHKDVIDKLIWEGYYKAPYDALMSHIFEGTAKVSGIYKITNLKNQQAYIGQSVDMRERFRQHIKTSLTSAPSTNKLYQQMKKYGPENFTFEVLEIVDRTKLNEREVYWIDFYKTKDYGMNGTKGGA